MQLAESPLLSLTVDMDGGIRLNATGPLAPFAKPIVKKINGIFETEKPISSGERLIFSTWIPPAPSRAFDRMISAQLRSLTRRRVPDQLSISVFRGCPNSCIHCSAPSRSGDLLERDLVKRVISESLDLGTYLVTFDGGEPMLRQDLPELVAAVDERAIATCFTSGYALSENLALELKKSGLYAVRVSIDSPVEEQHDHFRGRKGAFRDAISGVRNALSAGLLVDLFMVVSPYNIDQLEDAYSLACDLGAHELSLYEIVAVGRWKDHADEVLSHSDIEHLAEFHMMKNRLPDGPRVTALPYLLSPEMFGCFAGRRWMHVDPSGDVMPCAYMPISFGNVRKSSLKDIWRRMSRYSWFRHRCSCQMKDDLFRHLHFEKEDLK
ncbi:MAG: radical SAM protein [Methanothrix sp.]|uniref:radical SAM protein n=1 Tax=Methanothrix sp. TaxID=90426 RepID=UPI0025FD2C77|nr:radical SAM protein [Methanothrix sp.]MCQ8902613.1 radical SAM protein [Methanothrix sp.]